MAIFTAAAALGTSILTAVGATTLATSFAFSAFVGFLAQTALGVALNALTPKPKRDGANRGYQVTTKGSALDHQIIYGRMRVGGVIVYDRTTGNKNKFLHRVIAFAGHEVESFDGIYIDDDLIEIGGVDYTIEYSRDVVIPGTEGSTTEQVSTITLTGVPSSAQQFSVGSSLSSSEYNTLVDSAAEFTDDNPPNSSTTAFNYATILTRQENNTGGVAGSKYKGKIRVKFHNGSPDQLADSDLVAEDDKWTESHRLRNIAYVYIRLKFDQDIFPTGVPEITATIRGKKVYDPRDGTTAWSDNPALCIRDYLTSGYGLSEEVGNIDDNLVKAAANVCDRKDTIDGNTRYTCNGAFVTQVAPVDIINDLLTSMGGLLWYAQGEWRMKPAYYVAPTVTFTEDDLRSNVAVKTRHSRRDNYNTVAGTFRGSESDWQVTDYPSVTNQDFVDADNGQESVLDLELPFTDNSVEARRIARISLERNRQQLTVSASFGLRAFQVQVGDIVKLSIDRFGWTEKEFEVSSWTFGLTDQQDLQVQMTLREISSSVFDEVDDGIVYERDNTELLDPFDVPDLGFTVTGVAKEVREKLLNTLLIEVTISAEERVDKVEVEYRPSGQVAWESVGSGSAGFFEVIDVAPGDYDVRVRAVNSFGVRGDWVYQYNISIDSFGGSPEDVREFSYEITDSSLTLFWEAIAGDLSHYTVRHNPNTTNATWGNGTTAVEKVARPGTSVSLPIRSGTYLIRSVDKSGIASEGASSLVVLPEEMLGFTNTTTQTEDPTFSGVKTGLTVDTSRLRLTAPVTAGDTGEYEFSSEIDTGSVRRVWTYIVAPNIRVSDSAGLFDDTPGQFDRILGLFDAASGNLDLADTNIRFFISTTEDDPAGTPTWSAWKHFRAGYFYGRAFRYKIEMSTKSDQATPSLTELDAIVEYN